MELTFGFFLASKQKNYVLPGFSWGVLGWAAPNFFVCILFFILAVASTLLTNVFSHFTVVVCAAQFGVFWFVYVYLCVL